MEQSESFKIAGMVNLYKPPGTSSARYVYRLRRAFGIRKVGHAGTLDPFADGVLLGCVGRGTKLVERLMTLPKHYRTTLRLGVTSASFDTEQPLTEVPGAEPSSLERIEKAVGQFLGEIDQVPPRFSAVKIGGVPSYRLARQGIEVDKPAKRVRIDEMIILTYRWPLLELDIRCGRGCYIRAIARDLGKALESGACCESLTRLAIGPFRMRDAINLETASPEDVRSALVGVDEVVRRIEGDRRDT